MCMRICVYVCVCARLRTFVSLYYYSNSHILLGISNIKMLFYLVRLALNFKIKRFCISGYFIFSSLIHLITPYLLKKNALNFNDCHHYSQLGLRGKEIRNETRDRKDWQEMKNWKRDNQYSSLKKKKNTLESFIS